MERSFKKRKEGGKETSFISFSHFQEKREKGEKGERGKKEIYFSHPYLPKVKVV